jgi:hypothetical protein
MLFGILMAVAGYSGFDLVGLKGDLGALVFGMLVASHPKASELANTLLGFKNLFLVGFFLNIGISGTPTMTAVGIALLLSFATPLKAVLFFTILTRFKLRARTSYLSALTLANYSEFGLIVAALAVANGWISPDWLVILAIAVSISFATAAPANSLAHNIFNRISSRLKRFETAERLPGEELIDPGDAEIAILGMGGLGTAAYDEMRRRYGDAVVGLDFCPDTVKKHRQQGRKVLQGDASDIEFWERVDFSEPRIDLIMMALPDTETSAFVIRMLHKSGYQGQITASVRYEDDIELLKAEGVDAAYSLYEEAGTGFADHVCEHMSHCGLGKTI